MKTERTDTPLLRPCTLLYAVLLGLTTLTWTIGQAGQQGLGLSLLVLVFALVKGQLIGDGFMGLRAVRGPWRWVITLWLSLSGGLIAVAFVLSHQR